MILRHLGGVLLKKKSLLRVDEEIFEHVLNKLNIQLESAREWRDRINTYFYRMTGIIDSAGRKIY